MILKNLLISIALLKLVIAIDEPLKVGLDSLKLQYQRLTDCQTQLCAKTFKIELAQSSDFQACQVGCNYNADCVSNCQNFDGSQNEACQKGCKYDLNQPTVIDIANSLKNEADNKPMIKPFIMVHGEPVGPTPIDQQSVVDVKLNDDDDDDDSDSSSEETIDDNAKVQDISSDSDSDSFFGFLNPFKLMDIVNNAYEKAKSQFNGTNFIYYARLLENGTIIESYNKPIDEVDDSPFGGDESISPFKIINAILADHGMIPVTDELPPGRNPHWKGRPLQFGNPVVEEVSNQYPVDERGYIIRECRPLSFSFKTMCYDINNFFTCASMRTGLPRWFFVSTILISSLFMFWLGIFMLSMIRRMKRVQRTIILDEDQLPLYKDVVIEKKFVPTNNVYEAGPLPEKVKIENA